MKKKITPPQISLIMGILLIIFTFVFGKSQFQTYEDLEVFGGGREYPSHEKIPITQQRIDDDFLIPIIIFELVGTVTLTYLLRKKCDKT